MAAAGVLPLVIFRAHHGRSRVGQALRRDHRQTEPSNGGLQLVGRDVGGDLHHHLVLDQAGLGGRRNIHDPALEAGQDLPSAGSGARRAPAGGCAGVLIAPWILLTTGGVLSAASWIMAVRF